MGEYKENSSQVLDILLGRAARDPEFRKKFFSDSQGTLKDLNVPEDIQMLIVRCLTNLTKFQD
ncbi:MAG TPA: hypothetical protein VF884_10350 [Nitrososphaeraceae archaeon]